MAVPFRRIASGFWHWDLHIVRTIVETVRSTGRFHVTRSPRYLHFAVNAVIVNVYAIVVNVDTLIVNFDITYFDVRFVFHAAVYCGDDTGFKVICTMVRVIQLLRGDVGFVV